jgi:hypothetical protein
MSPIARSGASHPQPADFVRQVHDRFLAACRRAGRREFHYRIAGEAMSLAVAGDALASALTPALAHLTAPPGEDSLTICAWDGSSTGVAPPVPAWTGDDYYGNGAVRGFDAGCVRAAFDPWLGLLSLYDADRRRAFVWLRDSRRVPITIAGTPLRVVFQWWADQSHRVLLHAAAVGVEGAAILIAGASGSGKSTTALVALTHGFSYLGDDFVLVEPEPDARVHALYNSAKIDEATLAARFPGLQAAVHARERAPHEKHLLFVHAWSPGALRTDLPVAALLLPVVSDRIDSRVAAAGAGDALKALVPGLLAFPGMRSPAVERLARLVRRVPSFRLDLGRDSAGIASTLRAAILASSAGDSRA